MSDSTIKEPSEAHKSLTKAKSALAKKIELGFEQIDRGDAMNADGKLFDQLHDRIEKGSKSKRQ